jgi:hypothetical protein
MVFKRTEALTEIADSLGAIKSSCEHRGLLHLFDNNTVAQHFFCRLLNAVYGLELVVLDNLEDNFPAVDLGDTKKRIAYQVTTQKVSEKVTSTLEKFKKHRLYEKFDVLKILVVGDRQQTYGAVEIPSDLTFSTTDDILDVADLLKHINTLDTVRLEAVQIILVEEFTSPLKRSPATTVCATDPQATNAEPASNIAKARASISPTSYASCVTGEWPSTVFQNLLTDAAKGMNTELRNWEELTSVADREFLLSFTDRFLACPQQTTSIKGFPSERKAAGMHIDLDFKRGAKSDQLIIRDVIVEVVQFHSVAPTFIPGIARVTKPIIAVEISNRQSPLPWSSHAKWIADSFKDPFRDFIGEQISVTSLNWETLLLRVLATDRGIYMYNIHVVVQQDDDAPLTIRVTDRPLITGFFSKPKEDHPDYTLLQERYKRRGGMMQSKIAFDEWLERFRRGEQNR